MFGDQFRASGYRLTVSNVSALTPGSYTMYVFARSTLTGQFTNASRRFIRVEGGAMAVDLPGNGAHATGAFIVAGWAIDADAASGPGVDAIHVWAFPPNNASPVFIGATTPNTDRPDIAAIFGSRFLTSGFNLVAPALPRGTYLIAVFAHSAATGTFSQVRTVTITID